jgi:hypothetical protein
MAFLLHEKLRAAEGGSCNSVQVQWRARNSVQVQGRPEGAALYYKWLM